MEKLTKQLPLMRSLWTSPARDVEAIHLGKYFFFIQENINVVLLIFFIQENINIVHYIFFLYKRTSVPHSIIELTYIPQYLYIYIYTHNNSVYIIISCMVNANAYHSICSLFALGLDVVPQEHQVLPPALPLC